MKLSKLMSGRKGFTLIELLVVIAVLGILASVVLVAINPSERIKEASDTGIKNNVSQVATGAEACYTNNEGDYDNCDTTAELLSGSYLKRDLGTDGVDMAQSTGGEVVVWGLLEAASTTCDAGTTVANKYWTYRSLDGTTQVECPATAPADGTFWARPT